MAPFRSLALTLTATAMVWSAVVVAAPSALASDALGPAAAIVYAASSQICHQRAERSFSTAGRQWPVCARCAGLYLSGAAGALLGWIGLVGWDRSRARWLLAMAAAPTALTWALEFGGVVAFSNGARAAAAIPLGVAAGWLFVQMLRYDSGLDAGQIHSSRTPSLPR